LWITQKGGFDMARATRKSNIATENKLTVTFAEGQQLTGLGAFSFHKLAEESGSIIQVNRRKNVYLPKLQEYLASQAGR
jgi:hypothetical protein